MGTVLVEKDRENQRVYNTVLVKPESLNVFSNGLPMKIVRELGKQPQCAMDLARKLKEHEQNVYYHLKRLRNAGLIRLLIEENRSGMTAKIYELVSPVIAAKLHEEGYRTVSKDVPRDPEIEEFLKPFIKGGKLNARIILGSPRPHGRYAATARDGVHAVDLALFLGSFLTHLNSMNYKLDTEVKEKDLEENLIIIGNPKINAITDKLNGTLPVYFDKNREWSITSKISGNSYDYDHDAVIIRTRNPFNKKNEILILAGKRSAGLETAVLAFTRHMEEIMKGNDKDKKIMAKVVRGFDKDSDGIIDSVEFLE
ncbi:MAG: helix-turn-helix domain-containing protein [Candidatus Aenigmarchaeota archaeon]|nr:helix-turn-helix domain-containing protein [Candidatus Aenigmarchaeota archaeon]